MLCETELAHRTFVLERTRAIASGVLDTAAGTFLLLIAVKAFEADAVAKGFLAAGGSAGLLISLFVPVVVAHAGLSNQRAAALCHFFGGGFLLASALLPVYSVFVFGGFFGFAAMTCSIPLLTQIFQDNYPQERRGSLFAAAVIWRIATATLFSLLAGWFLSDDVGRHPFLMAVFSGAAFFSGWCLWHVPVKTMEPGTSQPGWPKGAHPLRVMREDATFRWTIIAWMLTGIAMLTIVPLRVEYLANPEHGIAFNPAKVALITGVIPNLSRLVMTRVWGWLFDRVNFFVLRILLNAGFMVAILTFFLGSSDLAFYIAAAIFGVGMAGADIAWSLWVTKLASPSRVAEYMAVHTFFTGIRGVLMPFIGFQVVKFVPFAAVAISCVVLIGIAGLMLVPEIQSLKRRRSAVPLIVEGDQE